MRKHDIYCHKLEPRQHIHDLSPALVLNHALGASQVPVVRLYRQLSAAGRDDQAQGNVQVIMAHLCQHVYLLIDHRIIYFGSNSCTAFARPGCHVSGSVVLHTDTTNVVSECHAAARDGGQEGPSGPSGRATEPDNVSLPLGGVEVDA